MMMWAIHSYGVQGILSSDTERDTHYFEVWRLLSLKYLDILKVVKLVDLDIESA